MPDHSRVEQLPQDDWADQDILTRDEASGRLREEIVEVRTELDRATDTALAAELSDRLRLLREAAAYLTKPPTLADTTRADTSEEGRT